MLAAAPTEAEAAALKRQVFAEGAALRRGTAMAPEQRAAFRALLERLAALNPTPRPAEAWADVSVGDRVGSLVGVWDLVWSDAPDVARPGGVKTGQRIAVDATGRRTITNVVEVPLPWGTVELGVETLATPLSPTRVDLRIRGIDAKPSASWPWFVPFINLFDLLPKSDEGSPFGSFDVLYLDDSLRVTQTNSGYYTVNQRVG